MRLEIAIPALNEEDSIRSIIERTLAAIPRILSRSAVTQVSVTVVSDGSTDRTVEIAQEYRDRIKLIVFKQNRGYGAAIKEAWDRSDAELLGFLDADGTCDPDFFGELCASLEREQADLALGSRVGKGTRMPVMRQIGNRLFASLLTVLSGRRVEDTASGMRVLRRAAYAHLLPLPNGLNFTPAMSARALLGVTAAMKVIEIPMSYDERQGHSKLRVVRDGFRFLQIILEALFLYRPSRPLGVIGLACLLIAIIVMAAPIAHYLRFRNVEDWMIYRFVVGHLAGVTGFLFLSVSLLCRLAVRITITGRYDRNILSRPERAFLSPYFLWVPVALLCAGTMLLGPRPWDLHGRLFSSEHWSRFVAMSFCYLVAFIFVCTRLVAYILLLIARQLEHQREHVARHISVTSC
jgi:glycosyltransferase involved in cell wall biosynthesis